MYPIGTRVATESGYTGRVVAKFADGVWIKKFLECPRCDKATWEVHTAEADLTEDSGAHSLIVDEQGRWHAVDESRIGSVRDPITSVRFAN